MKKSISSKQNIFPGIFLALLIFLGFCFAQQAGIEKEKAKVLKTIEQWYQTMKDGNLEAVKDFFPKDIKVTSFQNRKKHEQTLKDIQDEMSDNFNKWKWTSIKELTRPSVYVAKDGNTAWVYYESEFEYYDIKTKKENTYIAAALEILVKENGNWVFHTSYYESLPAERETTIVENDILDEYTGKYQSSVSGNTYTVTNDGKNLIFVNDKNEDQTIFSPESETVFFNNDYPQSLIFCRDRQGKISHYVYAKNGFISIIKKIK